MVPLVLIGGAICFLGEMVQNLYLLMTALLMANYGMWISCLKSIDVNMNDNGTSMWVAIDRGVYLMLITVSLFIAAKSEEAVKNFQAALAFCTGLVPPLLDFIQTLLLTENLGCEMTGTKTEYFPNGGPVPKAGDTNSKCDLKGQDYKIIFNVMRVLFWLSIPTVTKLSGGLAKPKEWFKRLVYALVGATLMVKTFMDLLTIIIAMADPNALKDINLYFPTIKPWIVYGITAVGFLKQTKGGVKVAPDPAGKITQMKEKAAKMKGPGKMVMKLLSTIEEKLDKLETMVAGTKS